MARTQVAADAEVAAAEGETGRIAGDLEAAQQAQAEARVAERAALDAAAVAQGRY